MALNIPEQLLTYELNDFHLFHLEFVKVKSSFQTNWFQPKYLEK